MIKKYILPILCFSTWAQAQFPIQGELIGYEAKPVLIKVYENGSPTLAKRLTTNQQGKFSYDYPSAYTGKIIFELVEGSFDVIAANSPIKFKMDVNDPSHKLIFDGGVNQSVNENFDLKDKRALKEFTLTELLKLYSPQDDFYKALQKEIRRIDNLSPHAISSESVQYYIDAKNELAEYNSKKYNPQEVLAKSKKHLISDNDNLETFGLLQEFLSVYISYSVEGAVTREEAADKIEAALDSLLQEAQIDTQRGQIILSTIIPMLEGNGFDALTEKYMGQAEALTCEITPELKELIMAKNNIKVGSKVPNIVFDRKIKNASSLYDVEADKKLLIFWASWCPHCMHELPNIKAFYDDFVADGGEIVAISLDLDEHAFHDAIDQTRWINYSDFNKWESPLVAQFGITATPTMILLDKDNKVLQKGSKVADFK